MCLHQTGDAEKDTSEGSKKRWFEEKKKRQEEQLAKMGLTPDEAYRLESAEVAEAKHKKKVHIQGRLWALCVASYSRIVGCLG